MAIRPSHRTIVFRVHPTPASHFLHTPKRSGACERRLASDVRCAGAQRCASALTVRTIASRKHHSKAPASEPCSSAGVATRRTGGGTRHGARMRREGRGTERGEAERKERRSGRHGPGKRCARCYCVYLIRESDRRCDAECEGCEARAYGAVEGHARAKRKICGDSQLGTAWGGGRVRAWGTARKGGRGRQAWSRRGSGACVEVGRPGTREEMIHRSS